MSERRKVGEWFAESVTRHSLYLECGVEIVMHRSTPGSPWRYWIRGFGKENTVTTKERDPVQAKRLALRDLSLRLEIANSQASAILIDIGTGLV